MKKILLLSLMIVFVFASTTLYAAEKYDLGMGNIALKVDYINFTEDAFDDDRLGKRCLCGTRRILRNLSQSLSRT